jgi:hypothetical protein
MTRFSYLAVALGVALTGCEKNAVTDITAPDPGSRVKFFNFTVSTSPTTTPTVHFYANDTKMSATLSSTGTEGTGGIGFGGVSSNALYSAIAPGQYTIRARITTTADNGQPMATLPVTIEGGKHYSFYTSGMYDPATKTSDAFIVEDPISAAIDFSQPTVRFVHASHNANPMALSVKRTSPLSTPAVPSDTATYQIGGSVAYKGAGVFVGIPSGTYTLTATYTGGAVALTRTNVAFTAGRTYTIAAIGDITVASGTYARRLDNTVNR